MTFKPTNILLFGGTGVIGQHLLHALLLSKSHFGRIAIFTSPSTVSSKATELESLRSQGVDIIVGDVQKDDDVLSAYTSGSGFDTIISAVGRNVIAKQIDLVRLAEATECVKRFYPSEFGTDIEYAPSSAFEKPNQQKLKVRAFIRESVRRLEYTYLVTGPYAELFVGKMPVGKEVGSFDVEGRKAVLIGSGRERVSLTTMPDVGKLLVASMLHPDVSRNTALKVNSFTTTPDAILAEFERQTGGKWEVEYVSTEKLKEAEKEAWEKQDPMAALYTLRRIWIEGGTLYDERDNKKIGISETDGLESVVKEAIEKESAAFRSGEM